MSAHIYCDRHGCEAAVAANDMSGWSTVTAQFSTTGDPITRHVCPDCLGRFNQFWCGAATLQTEDGEEIKVTFPKEGHSEPEGTPNPA